MLDVKENGWGREPDTVLLSRAYAMGRVLFTHDNDFGYLATVLRQPTIGVFQVRPGHGDVTGSLQSIDDVLAQDPEVHVPFILVVKRTRASVTIRSRTV